jgi:hypothetical protein
MPSDFMNETLASAFAKAEAEAGVEPGTYGTVEQNPSTSDYVRAGLGGYLNSLPVVGQGVNFGGGLLFGEDYLETQKSDGELRDRMGEATGLGDTYTGIVNSDVGKVLKAVPTANSSMAKMGSAVHELFADLF